jgi:NADPH-dependent curcumin reductase CurA
MSDSRQFLLATRPEGEVKDVNFELVTATIPEPTDNQFVVEISTCRSTPRCEDG